LIVAADSFMSELTGTTTRSATWRIAVVTVVVSAVLAAATCFRLEVLIEDYFLIRLAPPLPPPSNIVLVAIDEDTLAKLPYRSPVDRTFLAQIIEKIDAAGPRAIGIDLLIDQPSEPAKDAELLAALKNAKSPIVMGFATASDGLTEQQIAFQKQALNGTAKGLVTLTRDDFDGTVRSIYPGRQIDGTWIASLSSALAQLADTDKTQPHGRISYYPGADGGPVAFTTYPAHAVAVLPPAWFKDKIILIGSALPTADRHPTPFVTTHGADLGTIYGVAIHAHILTQLMRGDSLSAPGPWMSGAIVLTLAAFVVLIVFLPIAPIWRGSAIILALAIYCGCAYLLFVGWQILIPVATPIVAALIAAIIGAMVQWYRDRAQRLFIEKAFSQYVSPAVVRRIASRRQSLKLGGESRMVTYVFTDLQGFTSLSETMEPAQVASLLNAYLDEISQLYVEAHATIDKIVGDAVIGFFGAPELQDDQAERAVDLALAIDRFSEDYRQAQRQNGVEFGITRIGVHKGEAIVGNFGGSRFFDYTGIGDTVNTAARMEAANRYLGTRICVSGAVASACPDRLFRPIGDIVLKGKKEPVTCFEPLHGDLVSPHKIATYKQAFEQMAGMNEAAAVTFAHLADEQGQDPLIKLHADRLRRGERGATIILTEK